MDLFHIDNPSNPKNLFLYRHKFSWIAFNVEDVDSRILMDCHEPFGIHLHIDQHPRLLLDVETIEEASSYFLEKVNEHFGIRKV